MYLNNKNTRAFYSYRKERHTRGRKKQTLIERLKIRSKTSDRETLSTIWTTTQNTAPMYGMVNNIIKCGDKEAETMKL